MYWKVAALPSCPVVPDAASVSCQGLGEAGQEDEQRKSPTLITV